MADSRLLALVCVLILSPAAQAVVIINEVYINPPGSSDSGREFIELLGTPGKKLDGYAIAILNGTEAKFHPLGSIPPIPNPAPEIDEFFSLDGLTLGSNGILVLGIQSGVLFWYPTLLSDSSFARWTTLWNGGLDTPGQLGNNGSVTLMLVRNRPGRTEADPTNPGGLRWGKDIAHDAELITPVMDPRVGHCFHTPDDANCPDDSLFCNGAESCDAVNDCVSSGDPCLPDKVCNETTDACDDCVSAGDCDDGVACTDDTCPAGSCVYAPNDANCPDDGLYCNGAESCNAVDNCVSSGNPCLPSEVCNDGTDTCDPCQFDIDCEDGVGCTDDTCSTGGCVYTPNDLNCPDDGFFCNGSESCDAVNDCVSSGDPCQPGETCNETTNTCDECQADTDCDDGVGCTEDVCLLGLQKDQWGDGIADQGQPDGLGGDTLDMPGATTFGDITDDLEIADEVSYEDGRGWEYDVDGREVDEGSTAPGLPHRDVHTLDDPGGINPDALSRVDYRTKGDGWAPASGGTGEMLNGNNWPDTATEQWVRGEGAVGSGGQGAVPQFFYVNDPNPDPEAVQPYETHVPLWLDDDVPPDYDFGTSGSSYTYQIMAGRLNPLAVPFIPGDCDRDGDCDADDISKLAAVFGDDDWIFSNAFGLAPEGTSGDPAEQTRPWDVDATGDNGIEASDLQWTLNFRGDTTGQIVGVQYVSTNGATSGVFLNPNAGVECTVTTLVNIPSGRTLTTLLVGDIVEVTVRAQVTAGASSDPGEKNGIMQYVHDVAISSPGIMKVTSIAPIGAFSTTRASLQALQGTDGDLGVSLINGFTTVFGKGLTGQSALYTVTLEAIGWGSADITISPAGAGKFAASTPHGLKVGHTDSNGDPGSSVYPAPLTATPVVPGDLDRDGDVDLGDWALLWPCLTGPGGGILPGCDEADLDADGDADLEDFSLYETNFTGGG